MRQPAPTDLQSPISILPSVRQTGRLDLHLARIAGVTRPVRCVAQPPVQLSRARYPSDTDAAHFTLVHLGGILAGDRYELAVSLEAGTVAEVTTAAATQVLSMPNGDAEQTISLRLASESRLAWLPEPLILFRDANFTQRVRIDLSPGASLAYLDVLVPGRLGRGEVFRFARYATQLEVYDGDKLLVAERAVVDPRRHDLAAPGVLGATPVVGSLYLLGNGVDVARGLALAGEIDLPGLGATALPNQAGCLIRLLGQTSSAVHAQLLRLWRGATIL